MDEVGSQKVLAALLQGEEQGRTEEVMLLSRGRAWMEVVPLVTAFFFLERPAMSHSSSSPAASALVASSAQHRAPTCARSTSHAKYLALTI